MLWLILLVMNALLAGLVCPNVHLKLLPRAISIKSIPINALIVVLVLMFVRLKLSVRLNLNSSIKKKVRSKDGLFNFW